MNRRSCKERLMLKMSNQRIKVLLIEDNPDHAELIRSMLADAKGSLFEIERVDLLSAGLERLVEGGVDLVLLDLSLSDCQGMDTFVKVHAQAPDVPVVVLSALDNEKIAIQAVHAGAQDYLAKGQIDSKLLGRSLVYAIERKRVEMELAKYHHHLEGLVKERTAELTKANVHLRQEIIDRKQVEDELRTKTLSLEEVNTALRVLLKKKDEIKAELGEKVLFNVKELVVPYLEKLKNAQLGFELDAYLNILETNLNDITSSFSYKLSSKYLNLTPMEIRVASFIKLGQRTKEIAQLLNLSNRTIESHRDNIRKKLGIKNKKANLRTHLLSFQ